MSKSNRWVLLQGNGTDIMVPKHVQSACCWNHSAIVKLGNCVTVRCYVIAVTPSPSPIIKQFNGWLQWRWQIHYIVIICERCNQLVNVAITTGISHKTEGKEEILNRFEGEKKDPDIQPVMHVSQAVPCTNWLISIVVETPSWDMVIVFWHLWHHIKRKLNEYENPPQSLHQLWERVEKEWNVIDKSVCQGLIESYDMLNLISLFWIGLGYITRGWKCEIWITISILPHDKGEGGEQVRQTTATWSLQHLWWYTSLGR